jgi:hypothetical protein
MLQFAVNGATNGRRLATTETPVVTKSIQEVTRNEQEIGNQAAPSDVKIGIPLISGRSAQHREEGPPT